MKICVILVKYSNVNSNILEKKIIKEHLTNYLKHSYKIYKS